MNVIFAKHENSSKEFCFEVPEGMMPIYGDILYVETSKGNSIAYATSRVITGDNVIELVQRTGAYFPLKKVITYANNDITKCVKAVEEKMHENSKEIPF